MEQDKVPAHKEFLEKFNVRHQMKDALLKLIENRPEEPLQFLSNYFDSISSENKADRISNAARTLQLSHHSSPVFQNNMMIAYDILSAPKNPNSKKLVYKRSGMSGSVHEELLNHIGKNISDQLKAELVERVSCRGNEMVPYEVFRYSITVAYVLLDFVDLSDDLFKVLSGKNETVDRYLCDTTVETFREALDKSNVTTAVTASMQASRKLRPDNLASIMLQAKHDEGDAKNVMESEEFVHAMTSVYLENVKCIR